MKFTFKLHEQKNTEATQSVEVLSVDKQEMPICLAGNSNQAIYCGLLDGQGSGGNEG